MPAAVTDAYATAAEYYASTGKATLVNETPLETDLLAISRYIDGELSRFFTKDAAPVARIYKTRPRDRTAYSDWAESENPWRYGGFRRILDVDDLVSVTSIKIDDNMSGGFADDTALAAGEYELTPLNAARGPEPGPYTAIELTPWGSRFAWPPNARVQITGIWGWPDVPAAIKDACIQLTSILRLESPRARREMTAPGVVLGMSAPAQNIVQDLMSSYSRRVGL